MNDNVLPLRIRNQEVPPREDRDWVTGPELTTEAGITYRQCDYWTRTGLLTVLGDATPGQGNYRRYPADQIARARAIADLLDAGISLQTIRDVIDQLVDEHQVTVGHITFTYQPGGDAA